MHWPDAKLCVYECAKNSNVVKVFCVLKSEMQRFICQSALFSNVHCEVCWNSCCLHAGCLHTTFNGTPNDKVAHTMSSIAMNEVLTMRSLKLTLIEFIRSFFCTFAIISTQILSKYSLLYEWSADGVFYSLNVRTASAYIDSTANRLTEQKHLRWRCLRTRIKWDNIKRFTVFSMGFHLIKIWNNKYEDFGINEQPS